MHNAIAPRRHSPICQHAAWLMDTSRRRGLDANDILAAIILATHAHAGQKRESDGSPYVTHSIQVAHVVAAWGATTDLVVAALLHDVVEDAPEHEPWLASVFGAAIADMVQALSKNTALATRRERVLDQRARFAAAMSRHAPELGWIKLADRAHNLATSAELPTIRRQRMLNESAEYFAPLALRLDMPDLADWMVLPSAWALGPWPVRALTALGRGARPERKFA